MNTKDLENYNFISDLFITAAPEVPDAISSNAIEQKIINKQIHRRIKFEPKRNYKPLLTAAACFAVLIGIITLFNFFGVNADKAETFKNEQEFKTKSLQMTNIFITPITIMKVKRTRIKSIFSVRTAKIHSSLTFLTALYPTTAK